ncbi:hypothetical protein ACIF6G_34405, partial [Streptomyces sp. NPDC086010]
AEPELLDRAREILATTGTGGARQTERAEGAVLMALQHAGLDVARALALGLGRGSGNGPAPTGQDRGGATAVAAWRGKRLPGLVAEVNRQLRELGVRGNRVNDGPVLRELEALPALWSGRNERAVAAEIAGRLANGGKGPLGLRGGMRLDGLPEDDWSLPPAPGSEEYEFFRSLSETWDGAPDVQEGFLPAVPDDGTRAAEQWPATIEAAEHRVAARGLRLVIPTDGDGLMASLAEVLHALYPAWPRLSADGVRGLLAEALHADLILAPDLRALWPRVDNPAERWHSSLFPQDTSGFGDTHRLRIIDLMGREPFEAEPAIEIAVEVAVQNFPWGRGVLHGYGPDDLYWGPEEVVNESSPVLVRFHAGGFWAAAVPDADGLLAAWEQPEITAEERRALRSLGPGLTETERTGVVWGMRTFPGAAPAALLHEVRNGSLVGLRPRTAATVSSGDHDGTGDGLLPLFPQVFPQDSVADVMDVMDTRDVQETGGAPEINELFGPVGDDELFGPVSDEVPEPPFVLELPLPPSSPTPSASKRSELAKGVSWERSTPAARVEEGGEQREQERRAEEVLKRVQQLRSQKVPSVKLAGALLITHKIMKSILLQGWVSPNYIPEFVDPGNSARLDKLEEVLSRTPISPVSDIATRVAADEIWARVRRIHDSGVHMSLLAPVLPFAEETVRNYLSPDKSLGLKLATKLVQADVSLFLDGLEAKQAEKEGTSAAPQHDGDAVTAPQVDVLLAGRGLSAVTVPGSGDDFASALAVAAGLVDGTGAPLSAVTVWERLVAEMDDEASPVWWYLGDEARGEWMGRRPGSMEIPPPFLPLVASQAFGLSLNVLSVRSGAIQWEAPPDGLSDGRTAAVVWTVPDSWTAAVPNADALLSVRGVPKMMKQEREFLDREAPALDEAQRAAVIWARRHLGEVNVRILTEAFRLHFPHAFQPHTAPPRPGTLDVTVPDLRRAVQAVATGHTTAAAPPSGGRGAGAGSRTRRPPASDEETVVGVDDLLTLNPALTRSGAEHWGSRFAEARRTMSKLPGEAYQTAMQEAAGYMGGHRSVLGAGDGSRVYHRVHGAMVERIAFVLTRAHRERESQPSQQAEHESLAMAKAFGTGRREGLPGGMPSAGGGEGESAYITVLRQWPESAAQSGGRPSSLSGIDFAVARLSGESDVLDAVADVIRETGAWSAENAESAWRGRVENLDAATREYQWALISEQRGGYIREVEGLASLVSQMRQSGATEEYIARSVHEERRNIGVKYKSLTPPVERQVIYNRNTMKYGDPLGPTVDWLRERGKEWGDIIESASRTGGADLGLGKGQI